MSFAALEKYTPEQRAAAHEIVTKYGRKLSVEIGRLLWNDFGPKHLVNPATKRLQEVEAIVGRRLQLERDFHYGLLEASYDRLIGPVRPSLDNDGNHTWTGCPAPEHISVVEEIPERGLLLLAFEPGHYAPWDGRPDRIPTTFYGRETVFFFTEENGFEVNKCTLKNGTSVQVSGRYGPITTTDGMKHTSSRRLFYVNEGYMSNKINHVDLDFYDIRRVWTFQECFDFPEDVLCIIREFLFR